MKSTRPRGTTRAARPVHSGGHPFGYAAFEQADSTIGIEGVGMT